MKKNIKIISVAALIGLLIIMNYRNQQRFEMQYGNPNKEAWGMTRKEFVYNLQLPSDAWVLEAADKLLNGELVVLDTIEIQPYSLGSMDWNASFSDAYQEHLQALNPIAYLTKAYELTKEKKYLDLGKSFLEEWDNYRVDDAAKENILVWDGYVSAMRVSNIVYFVLSAEKGDKDYFSEEERHWISEIVEEHAKLFAQRSGDINNLEAGICQDQALLYCTYFLNNENKAEWISLAEEGLSERKNYAYNSPDFQRGVIGAYQAAAELCSNLKDKFSDSLNRMIDESAEFMAYMIKPDGRIAEIGDADDISWDAVNSKDVALTKLKNKYVKYALTMGKEGARPKEKAKVYPELGYYISRNNWEKKNSGQATWMMFKSGYASGVRKHADDNSFMLYSKGYDIFVDPGYYCDIIGNYYRDYLVSSNAHNTVIVDGKTYSPTTENNIKTGIYEYSQNDNYDYVLGFNEMYQSVFFDRHFYNLGDAIIIYDNLESESEHVYSQLLHTSEEMHLIEKGKNHAVYQLGEYYVRIQQLGENGENQFIHGEEEKQAFGYISRAANQIDFIDTVKYDVQGSNADIVTLITIEDKGGNIEGISNIEYDNDGKIFHITKPSGDTYEIELKARKRIHAGKVKTEKNSDDTFTFSNLNTEEGTSYAWYVIDQQTRTPIVRTDYSTDADFEYTFEEKGSYLIKAYTRSGNGRYRCSRLVAEVLYDEEKAEYYCTDANGFNLVYLGHESKKTGNGLYEFMVDFEYEWSYNISWHVYKDGRHYDSFATENEPDMQYTFTEPGKYIVEYYLRTPNGDNEVWNFEEINIE